MGKRKVALMLLAMAGIYFVAAGGLLPLVAGESLDYLLKPLEEATPFDLGICIMAILFVIWAGTLETGPTGITRTQLLRGVALGSVILAGTLCVVNLMTSNSFLFPEFPAIVSIIAIMQAFVGLGASLFLLSRRESRRASAMPLAMNLTVLCATGALFFMPLIQ